MNVYVNKKLKQVADRELIDDLKYLLKSNKEKNTYDLEITFRGTKLDGKIVSLNYGKPFRGTLTSRIIDGEMYLTI